MKTKILEFLHGLILYDYILFGSIFFIFILLIILAILFRKKVGFAIFLVLLAFAMFFVGPIVGYIELHKYLFKNSTKVIEQKKLQFAKAIVLKGSPLNESKFDFKLCKVTANVYKHSKNKYKNYIYRLKPIKKMSISLGNINRGENRKFKMIIEPFTYPKDYNISLEAKCK